MTRDPGDELHDSRRLAALDETRLVDHLPVESLDRFTRIAAAALRTPVSLVSLVDNRRQFFISQVGLPSPWDRSRETPLSHSFCQHVVTSRAPLVVEDSRRHPVVKDNPSVWDLNVIAYAGMPIETHDGHVLGSFCAIDVRPRAWTRDELAILRDLAAAVSEVIDLRRELSQARSGERPTAGATSAR